jgi:hypothetical protein
MPINPSEPFPEEPKKDIFFPDVHPDDSFEHAATHRQGYNIGIPDNFDELPPKEQELLRAQYRFGGIKLRGDIRDETIPVTRETMDIP